MPGDQRGVVARLACQRVASQVLAPAVFAAADIPPRHHAVQQYHQTHRSPALLRHAGIAVHIAAQSVGEIPAKGSTCVKRTCVGVHLHTPACMDMLPGDVVGIASSRAGIIRYRHHDATCTLAFCTPRRTARGLPRKVSHRQRQPSSYPAASSVPSGGLYARHRASARPPSSPSSEWLAAFHTRTVPSRPALAYSGLLAHDVRNASGKKQAACRKSCQLLVPTGSLGTWQLPVYVCCAQRARTRLDVQQWL